MLTFNAAVIKQAMDIGVLSFKFYYIILKNYFSLFYEPLMKSWISAKIVFMA